MNIKHIRTYLVARNLVVLLRPLQGVAQQNSGASETGQQLKLYAVSNLAHDRGYGPPEEVMAVNNKSRFSG